MANVLVVDDAKIMRINIRKILEQLNHTIISEASNGYEAINQYKLYKPDFVTMDITMPMEQGIEDGIEAVKQIIQFDPNAKIIMITSHGEQNKVIRAIQSGASAYMLKPLKKEKLEEILQKISVI